MSPVPPARRSRALLQQGRARRGAAFVEAVVVLSFMTVVLAGILYFGRYFEARQRAQALVRQCAWAYSRSSCQEDPQCGEPGHYPCLPPQCAELLQVEREPDLELRNKVADAQALVQSAGGARGSAATVAAQERFKAGVVEKTAEMLELLVGETVHAAATTSVAGSPALPGAPAQLQADYFLPCNLKPKSSLNVAVELFGTLKPVKR